MIYYALLLGFFLDSRRCSSKLGRNIISSKRVVNIDVENPHGLLLKLTGKNDTVLGH